MAMSALGIEVDSPEIVYISHADIPWKYLDRKELTAVTSR
jgi:hypothetical protein